MSDLHAIAYISRTNIDFSQADLEQLLSTARQFNEQHQISGVLLHNAGFFFQYFEGNRQSVDTVYQRIKEDSRHTITMEVFNAAVDKKYFDLWLMAFCTPPDNFILDLSQQSWLQKASEIKQFENDSLGLNMLIRFWDNFTAEQITT